MRTRSLIKMETDIEEAIFQGVSSILPEVEHLYCVRHLMQRDKLKINPLLQKVDFKKDERLHAK